MNTSPLPQPERVIVIRSSSSAASWVVAVGLLVIAAVLIVRPDVTWLGPAFAQNASSGLRGGVHAFTGQIDKNTFGLFMMDADNSTVWVYEFVPGKKRLRLAAARSFLYDRYLEEWNNDEGTSVDDIEKRVGMQRKQRLLAQARGTMPPPAPAPAEVRGTSANKPLDAEERELNPVTTPPGKASGEPVGDNENTP